MSAVEEFLKDYDLVEPNQFLISKTKPNVDLHTLLEHHARHLIESKNEVWRDLPGYEGLYQVSTFGNIKSLYYSKEKLLIQSLSSSGYLAISLVKNKEAKTRTTHQLVAEAFLNYRPNKTKLVINHINNIKTDNRLGNLEITTQRENSNRKHLNYTSKYTGVCWDKQAKRWRATIFLNGKNKHLGYFNNEEKAHLAYQNDFKKLINKNNGL